MEILQLEAFSTFSLIKITFIPLSSPTKRYATNNPLLTTISNAIEPTTLLFPYRLVGDVLLATAFLSYSGPFNQEYRGLLNRNWMKELKCRKIPFTANLNLIEMLTDPTQVTCLIYENQEGAYTYLNLFK